jgi:hypothetical protein
VKANEIDFAARQINVEGWMHKAFSGGASTCTAVAAQIEGTTPRRVRIGHPSGALPIFAQVERDPQLSPSGRSWGALLRRGALEAIAEGAETAGRSAAGDCLPSPAVHAAATLLPDDECGRSRLEPAIQARTADQARPALRGSEYEYAADIGSSSIRQGLLASQQG